VKGFLELTDTIAFIKGQEREREKKGRRKKDRRPVKPSYITKQIRPARTPEQRL
jgi:hypothetical protein